MRLFIILVCIFFSVWRKCAKRRKSHKANIILRLWESCIVAPFSPRSFYWQWFCGFACQWWLIKISIHEFLSPFTLTYVCVCEKSRSALGYLFICWTFHSQLHIYGKFLTVTCRISVILAVFHINLFVPKFLFFHNFFHAISAHTRYKNLIQIGSCLLRFIFNFLGHIYGIFSKVMFSRSPVISNISILWSPLKPFKENLLKVLFFFGKF